MLEAGQHPAAFFVTLTYKESELPPDGGVSKRDLQRYLKRLRYAVTPRRVRFFACAEYGDLGGRPHYHLALYGALVPREIRAAWQLGIVDISLLGPESAGYICGYILKSGLKANAAAAGRNPEFRLMSRNPGIGAVFGDTHGKALREHLAIDEDVPREVKISGKAWPLDRYLRERLRDSARVCRDAVGHRRDMDRALMLRQLTDKDRADLARMKEKDRFKADRAAARAAAVQKSNKLRKKL